MLDVDDLKVPNLEDLIEQKVMEGQEMLQLAEYRAPKIEV